LAQFVLKNQIKMHDLSANKQKPLTRISANKGRQIAPSFG